MIDFILSKQGDLHFAATAAEPRFAIGRETRYQNRYLGLASDPSAASDGLRYQPRDYPALGFWSGFIAPTAACEGGGYTTLNTYDRAGFTFGMVQFGAHVPDGGFVWLLRALLALPEAEDYFPDLALVKGRVARGQTLLENARDTRGLTAYLNPDPTRIDQPELLAAARLIHWTTNHAAARRAQVDETVRLFRFYLARADAHGLIDGRTADLCCIIADILHQGRGRAGATWPAIAAALASADPRRALLAIGADAYPERVRTLDVKIASDVKFVNFRWSSAARDFVPVLSSLSSTRAAAAGSKAGPAPDRAAG